MISKHDPSFHPQRQPIPVTMRCRAPRTAEEEEALLNGILDAEAKVMAGATGSALNALNRNNGKCPNGFKSRLARDFRIHTEQAQYAITRATALRRSALSNIRDNYLPQQRLRHEKHLQAHRRLVGKKDGIKRALKDTQGPEQRGRLAAELSELLMKIDGANRACQACLTRIAHYEHILETGRVSICLGSKKQLRGQHHLTEAGYASRDEWLVDYRHRRYSGVQFIGSKDKPWGGKCARLRPMEDPEDGFVLELNLSPATKTAMGLRERGMLRGVWFAIEGIRFPRLKDAQAATRVCGYGAQRQRRERQWPVFEGEHAREVAANKAAWARITQVESANRAKRRAWREACQGKSRSERPTEPDYEIPEKLPYPQVPFTRNRYASAYGAAVSVTFHRDRKGWQFHLTFQDTGVAPVYRPDHHEAYMGNGAIGVDTNVDHLAWCRVDRRGELVEFGTESLVEAPGDRVTRGKIWLAAAAIVRKAVEHQVPIIVEALDFRQKKMGHLSAQGRVGLAGERRRRANRVLSSFAYRQMLSAVSYRALEAGVVVLEVGACYTSFIGRLKYLERFSGQVHCAAAFVIARRGLSDQLAKEDSFIVEPKIAHTYRVGRARQTALFDEECFRQDLDREQSLWPASVLFRRYRQFRSRLGRRIRRERALWRDSLKPARRRAAKRALADDLPF